MSNEKRRLLDRFPEYDEKIHDLFETSTNFNTLCREYGSLTGALDRLESSTEPNAGIEVKKLRTRRADLEDELLAMMQQTARV
ncbi:MAG: hypothetical protein OEU09_24480 [Rhodospirillales bacterium]|nr:hypothetical protein [Rhodospirillales bacterium]MDH3914447.1 hypothetical protein [Rhodospirillales bacterium]MDH3970459.1 hypothetical protein [Rhodospirillales bacterium]